MQLTTVDLIDRYTVGWSDLLLFFDYRKLTNCTRSGIFLRVQFQNSANFTALQSFHFKKITRTLQIIFLFLRKFSNTFISMNTGQKENVNHVILGLQNGQNGLYFGFGQRKNLSF